MRKRFIIFSLYISGNDYMQQLYQDSVSLIQHFGMTRFVNYIRGQSKLA